MMFGPAFPSAHLKKTNDCKVFVQCLKKQRSRTVRKGVQAMVKPSPKHPAFYRMEAREEPQPSRACGSFLISNDQSRRGVEDDCAKAAWNKRRRHGCRAQPGLRRIKTRCGKCPKVAGPSHHSAATTIPATRSG
jgi:hypothetical protein